MLRKEIESRILTGIERFRLTSRFHFSPQEISTKRTVSGVLQSEDRLTGERRIIKVAPRNQVKKTLGAYPLVSEYFLTPEPRQETRNSFSYPFSEGITLDEIIRESPSLGLARIQELYQATTQIWKSSKATYNPKETVYDHKTETVQNLRRLKRQLSKSSLIPPNSPLVINGVLYPALHEIIDGFLKNFPEPRISVLDPGDANSQNIIVTPERKLVLIDIEKTGRYDPVYILARQLGQWSLYVEDPRQIFWKVTKGVRETNISYDPQHLPIVSALKEMAISTLGEFINKHDREDWEERLKAYLFVFFAKYAILSESWILRRYGSFASGPLLTEAIIKGAKPSLITIENEVSREILEPSRKLAIVIVNYNTGELLRECLDSLERTLSAGDLDSEIILVDNSSKDESMSKVRIEDRYLPIKTIFNDRNLGFAKATNQGIKETDAKYILLLNPDTQVIERSLQALVQFMEENQNVGVVGPLIKRPDGMIDWRCRRGLPELNLLTGKKKEKLTEEEMLLPGPTETLSGACMLVRKSVIDQVGLLDESYFLGIEDVDWCFRIGNTIKPKTGRRWEVYFYPQVCIIHHGGESRRQEKFKSGVELVRSVLVFANKNLCPLRPRWQRPLVMAGAFGFGVSKMIKSIVKYWK